MTSSTDKYFTVFDTQNGNIVCKGSAGERVSSMMLSADFKHLITASTDGCILFWKLHETFVKALVTRFKETGNIMRHFGDEIDGLSMPAPPVPKVQKQAPPPKPKKEESDEEDEDRPVIPRKSPAEILMEKNREREAADKKDMLSSLMGHIDNAVNAVEKIEDKKSSEKKKSRYD